MPALPASRARVLAYDFAGNELPGVEPYEDPAYWRDVGTLGALAQGRAEVEGDFPRFDLRNQEWPIRRDLMATLLARSPTPSSTPARAITSAPIIFGHGHGPRREEIPDTLPNGHIRLATISVAPHIRFDGCVTSMKGVSPISVIGAKSFSAS